METMIITKEKILGPQPRWFWVFSYSCVEGLNYINRQPVRQNSRGYLGLAHLLGSENRNGQYLSFKFGVGLQIVLIDPSDSQSQ